MPIYEYTHTGKRGNECADSFELLQGFNEPELKTCPECGNPVKKLISKPMRALMNTDRLTDNRISKSGLTKYVKTGDGTYEKAAGPDDTPSKLGE